MINININTKSLIKAGVSLTGFVAGSLVGEKISEKVVSGKMYNDFLEYQKSDEYKNLSDDDKRKKVNKYNTKATLTHAYISGLSQLAAGTGANAINQKIIDKGSQSSSSDFRFNSINVSTNAIKNTNMKIGETYYFTF